MTSSPNTIIFDLGNVLIKWNLYALFERFFSTPAAVDSFLAEVSFLEWNAHQDKGRPFAEGIALISEQYPQYAHIFKHFDEHWQDGIREVITENISLAQRLKQAGYPLYILSNFSTEKFGLTQKLHPIFSIFDELFISGEIGLIKPDPAIFHYMLERIQRPAQDCLFIDDHLPNIETARQLGFDAIHFVTPGQLEAELAQRGIQSS